MRHKVKDADYPAIALAERSKAVMRRELTSEENNIRGMLVSDLTAEDVRRQARASHGTMYWTAYLLPATLRERSSLPRAPCLCFASRIHGLDFL
ncbi:hypothetical protein EI94DRAFT_1653075 [Lactarius quietus]|nr:hypothetical protein EI94DRAFT_1653075 [Lactarius quietus]